MRRFNFKYHENVLLKSMLLLATLSIISCARGIDTEKMKEDIIKEAIPELRNRINFNNCWTAVGSTGIVDQGSRDIIKFGGTLNGVLVLPDTPPNIHNITDYDGAAYLLSTKKGVYHLRFPIHQQFLFEINSEPFETDTWNISLKARYKVINLEQERVYIRLNRYKLDGPLNREKVETMMTFDSDTFSADPEFQTNIENKEGLSFDFRTYGYYIDAQLIRKDSDPFENTQIVGIGTALGLVQLCVTHESID